jgi:hypothetical protein
MTQKHSEQGSPRTQWPWYWGLNQSQHNHIPDGPYAKKLDEIYHNLQNGSGIPPSDSRMDFCACNLALAHAMKNIKT